MSLNLLNSFGKRGVNYGLLSLPVDVIDVDYTSKYFIVSEFKPQFSSGKNTLSINGSPYLKVNSEILVECIDSNGNYLYVEMARTSDSSTKPNTYKESNSYVLSIHVYNDTIDGVGKLILHGTLADNKKVKWVRNITIDKTLKNTSRVRFYQRPLLEVESILLPVLNSSPTSSIISKDFTASVHGFAVTPTKDTNLASINTRNVNIDYRLVIDSPNITNYTPEADSCNSQMIGSAVNLVIETIQAPLSTDVIVPTVKSSSFIISDIYNNNTLILSSPYIYTDSKNNNVVTNILSSSLELIYPFVNYNPQTSSYLTTTIGNVSSFIKTSYAEIVFRNLRTFSGYVARYKLYKKSLSSTGDFEIVADEPLFINEILKDNLTRNKYYENLGTFYNNSHISKYWFTSSNNINLSNSNGTYINSMFVSSPNPTGLIGNDYIIVKNDSVSKNRNATYIPYNESDFLLTSGSSYDSNFMDFKANVQYIIDVSATIVKDASNVSSKLEFYFTSSMSDAAKEFNYTAKHGIKIATITASNQGTNFNVDNQIYFFTPTTDLRGTLVIVPYQCQSYIKNLSFRVYGDDGFSPDVFSIRIPWTISLPNESFEIKSELFDVNHSLIFSDLHILKSFDSSGASLTPYVPGTGGGIIPGAFDVFVSGSLIVSKSLSIESGSAIINVGNLILNQGDIYVPDIPAEPLGSSAQISQSRLLAVRGDGSNSGIICYSPIVNISHDNTSLSLTTNSGNRFNNLGATRRSIASEYTSSAGRRVYWVGGIKIIESGGGIWT